MNNEPFMNDDPMVTKTGRILTDADIEELADEAERGYDVSHLKGRPNRRGRPAGPLQRPPVGNDWPPPTGEAQDGPTD